MVPTDQALDSAISAYEWVPVSGRPVAHAVTLFGGNNSMVTLCSHVYRNIDRGNEAWLYRCGPCMSRIYRKKGWEDPSA